MKKVLPVILSVALLSISLFGCSKTTETPSTTDTPTTEVETEVEPEVTEPEVIDVSSLDPVTLKMWFHGSNITDDTAVMEKINEYLTEKINATLEPIWGTWSDFDDTVRQAINGGDNVDIYFTCSWTAGDEYNKMAKQGAWVRLDDPDNNLIEKYGSEVWSLLPEVLTSGAVVNGSDGLGVYAVPGYKDIATQNCWDINVDLLEKYGYTLDDIKNTDYYGFGDIMATVKEGEGKDFYPLLIEAAVLERMVTNSIIVTGDSTSSALLSYYVNPTNVSAEGAYGNEILNKFATPEYKKFVEKTREYFLAGYIDPTMGLVDQANAVRTTKQLAGEYLIGTQSYALGYEVEVSALRGIHVEFVPVTPAYTDTTASQGAMMAISTASQNPERAMMLLNLINTDPYLMTLLAFGVEDVHYTTNADGTIVFTEERANYSPWVNGLGNVTLLPAEEAKGADFQEKFKAYYGAAGQIPILGWAFDAENVTSEQGALANVAAEYAFPLAAGTVDPEVKLPEFLEKLDANGMQAYLDEANAQLSEFLALKGE